MRRTIPTLVLALVASTGLLAGPSGAEDMNEVFFTHCETSHVNQVDPVVAPRSSMSAHMHEFFGNTTTDANSTYASMVAGTTTCELKTDTAGYWAPPLVAPDGAMVRAQSINAYYRATGSLASEPISAYPPDLRMVSTTYFFNCGSSGSGTPLPGNCGSGSVHASIVFPACWDGMNTDSPDHLSHMAYQSGRGCPSTHPVAVPRLVMVVRYIGVHDGTGYSLMSGPATTMHADFWNTWNQAALEGLVQQCFNAATMTCGKMS